MIINRDGRVLEYHNTSWKPAPPDVIQAIHDFFGEGRFRCIWYHSIFDPVGQELTPDVAKALLANGNKPPEVVRRGQVEPEAEATPEAPAADIEASTPADSSDADEEIGESSVEVEIVVDDSIAEEEVDPSLEHELDSPPEAEGDTVVKAGSDVVADDETVELDDDDVEVVIDEDAFETEAEERSQAAEAAEAKATAEPADDSEDEEAILAELEREEQATAAPAIIYSKQALMEHVDYNTSRFDDFIEWLVENDRFVGLNEMDDAEIIQLYDIWEAEHPIEAQPAAQHQHVGATQPWKSIDDKKAQSTFDGLLGQIAIKARGPLDWKKRFTQGVNNGDIVATLNWIASNSNHVDDALRQRISAFIEDIRGRLKDGSFFKTLEDGHELIDIMKHYVWLRDGES
jgi:hypothetical protein